MKDYFVNLRTRSVILIVYIIYFSFLARQDHLVLYKRGKYI